MARTLDRARHALRSKDFRFLLAGRLVSQLADGVFQAYLIDRVSEIDDGWFQRDDTVLITAGASAPEEVVEECVAYLQKHFGATVESRTVREEHVSFPLPRELRVLAG